MYVRYKKARRTGEAANGGAPSAAGTAACPSSVHTMRPAVPVPDRDARDDGAGTAHRRRGNVRRDPAARGCGRLCTGGGQFLYCGSRDYRSMYQVQKKSAPETKHGTERYTTTMGGEKTMRTQRKWIYAALLSICMALFLITVPASAADTEKDLSGTAKLTLDIRSKEDQVQKLYAEVGRQYFEEHKEDDPAAYEGMAQIRELLAAVEDMKKELLDLKGAKVCPRCGEEVQATDAFCKSCGAKIEEDDIVVDAVVKDAPETSEEDADITEDAETAAENEITEEAFED